MINKALNRCFYVALVFLFLFASSLQAKNNKLKDVYDVLYYQIDLKIEPASKEIIGSNQFKICATKPFKQLAFDLLASLKISSISHQNQLLSFNRKGNEVVVDFPQMMRKGDTLFFTVNYSGKPPVAQNAPWDGGFVWEKDEQGKPWVGLACEGLGASSWLPCKDQWEDEPNGMSMHLKVPRGLIGVSNGRLKSKKSYPDGTDGFLWEVTAPINHYNITVNVGDYKHWEDHFVSANGKILDLNYYVLEKNLEQAKTHFQQVKRMLKAFEFYFGQYPFYTDGYKLVETPYWGMEHQSCVAYGNNYKNNKFGFDFIIIHESGHEWFANSITAKDKADMWIHEGFTTYSEALYVENQFGNMRAVQYLLEQKEKIKNELPIIGPRGVNYNRKDNDNYYKGTWILHSLRNILDNDTLWFNTLRDLNAKFFHQTVTSKQVEDFISVRTKTDLKPFFDQYLRKKELPQIEYFLVKKNGLNELHYRLNASVKNLKLPVKVTLSRDKYDYLVFEKRWKVIDLPYADIELFKVDEGSSLVKVK
ncbi:MAG: M1 family metallopeptidase [Bacteroidota bacterium]|nr:M1 family metallopeptidase [Bacteroidota bacterium]